MNILKDFISLVINRLNTLLNNEITRATAEESRLDTAIQSISTELSTDYQKKLVAGDNITIDPDTNEISASGGGSLNQYIMFFEANNDAQTRCSFVFCSKYDIGDSPDIFNGSTKKDWSDFMKKYFADFPNYNFAPNYELSYSIGIYGNIFQEGIYSSLLWLAPVQSGISSLKRVGVKIYRTTSNPSYAHYTLATYIDFDDATPINVQTIIQKMQ